ncbi:hypothetical protein [Sphingobium yanoikuyae]|uniref:hypothetical protein n=1 Tax=Sphingobium yanoikuyae TaxID=13690 RepID=UPI0028A75594|nr:hypothetical protein [Sphingobium yanoikuyae]
MRSVPSLAAMLDDGKPAPRPVVMPWEYVAMRRTAAGMTIEQAARPYWHRLEHRADVERNISALETVGFRMKRDFFVADMSRAYTFNLDVYRQLCDTPPDQHPRLCLACGWDQWSTQYDTNGEEATWSQSDPDLCTRCEQLDRKKVIG